MKKSRGNWGRLKKKKPLITHSIINSISLQSFSLCVAEAKWFLYIISAKIREMLTAWGSKLTLYVPRRRGNCHSFNKFLLRVEKALAFRSGHSWQTQCQALLYFLFPFHNDSVRPFIMPTPRMRALRLRKVKQLTQGHTAVKRRLELRPKPSWHHRSISISIVVRMTGRSHIYLDSNPLLSVPRFYLL